MMSKRGYIGSSLDTFLKKEGSFEAAETQAIKEVRAWTRAEAAKKQPQPRLGKGLPSGTA
jgi:hypothetical protein